MSGSPSWAVPWPRRHAIMIRAAPTSSAASPCISSSEIARVRPGRSKILGGWPWVQGRHADALGHSEQALRLYQTIGHKTEEARLLNGVGWCHALLGDYQRARAFCEQSLAFIAELGSCDFESAVWDSLGYIERHLGDFARAASHFESALGLCRDHGDRYLEAEILTHVGDARHAARELPQAGQAWQQALAIYDDLQHPAAGKVRAKLAILPKSAAQAT